jgi:cytochrome c oxidase assembly protein subunit 15
MLTGLVIAMLFAVRLADASTVIRQRANWLAYAVVAQVAIGYTQYFLNLPPSVVEIHVAGATLLWSATLWLQLGHTAPTPAPSESELAAVVGEVHYVDL